VKLVGIVMVSDLLELAFAYDAIVGERGRALGGGCRERIARQRTAGGSPHRAAGDGPVLRQDRGA
jgi:ABC-type protease/lipase transport system fused ATPase/permease subunit